jgi:hypothetical protein
MEMVTIIVLVLLVISILFSIPRPGHDRRYERRYEIERQQDGTLTTTSKGKTWSQITAENAVIEEARRIQRHKQVLLEAPYRGLFDKPEIETVDGEVMPDDAPQLGSGAPQLSSGRHPQLPSGEDRAIAKKSQWRGW